MKYFLIPIILLLLFTVGCGSGGQKNATVDSRSFRQVIHAFPEKIMPGDTVDFGRMKQGERVEYNLGVRNGDTTAMVILDILNGCGCTSLEYDKTPVMPGDTALIRLLYDSKGQHGFQLKSMQIVTTQSQKPLNVYLLADVQN